MKYVRVSFIGRSAMVIVACLFLSGCVVGADGSGVNDRPAATSQAAEGVERPISDEEWDRIHIFGGHPFGVRLDETTLSRGNRFELLPVREDGIRRALAIGNDPVLAELHGYPEVDHLWCHRVTSRGLPEVIAASPELRTLHIQNTVLTAEVFRAIANCVRLEGLSIESCAWDVGLASLDTTSLDHLASISIHGPPLVDIANFAERVQSLLCVDLRSPNKLDLDAVAEIALVPHIKLLIMSRGQLSWEGDPNLNTQLDAHLPRNRPRVFVTSF